MKITAFLLFAFCLQLSAGTLAQNVTLSEHAAPLEKVINQIKKQTGYSFFYNQDWLQQSKPVDINVKNMPLLQALKTCFANQPFDYAIVNETIVLKIRFLPPVEVSRFLSQVSITGKVTDMSGMPLGGASIILKRTNKAVMTNDKGEFNLVAQIGDELIVSYVGYEKQQIIIGNSITILNIQLKSLDSKLDELVIIGYGTTTKRLSTGNTATIKSEDISRQPVSNPLQALQGRVAGLIVNQASGIAGDQVNVQLRGQNSIGAASNRVLFIVDGIPLDIRSLPAQGRNSMIGNGATNGQSSPFNSINPADIESIDVLKDADATAIYGSRGANGVILITTKKGKAGKTNVDLNVYTGAGKVTNTLSMLNTGEYLALRRQAFVNDGVTPTAANAPDLLLWDQGLDQDFQKMQIGNTAHLTDASISITGGEKTTNFLISGAFHKEGSVYPKQAGSGYNRGSVRMNLNHASSNNKFKATASAYYSTDRSNLPISDLTTGYDLPPNYQLYNPDGSFYWGGGKSNPLAILDQTYNTKTKNLILNGSVGYNFLPNLSAKVNIGLNRLGFDQQRIDPSYVYPSNSIPSTTTIVGTETETVILEPQLDYNTNIGKGKFTATLGGTWQRSANITDYYITATQFSSDLLLENVSSASQFSTVQNGYIPYKYASVFGRLTYNWNGKYIVNGTFRRDGSSRFVEKNLYGNFGSIGSAWVFSSESFIKDNLSFLSFGKLRASYGSVGNDQISDYLYLDNYQAPSYSYGTQRGLYPTRVSNPELKWEVTKKLEIATDLGFFKDRVMLSVAWYRNRSGNMLVQVPLSPQTGFSSYTGNLPALVQNRGIEIELNTKNINKGDLLWETSFNISFAKNTLLDFPGIKTSTYANTYLIGQPLSIIRAYHYTGIKDGIPTVQDMNNDGTYTPTLAENGTGDYVVAGKTDPDFYGGLSNALSYKGLRLDVFIQFTKAVAYNQPFQLGPPGTIYNQNRDQMLEGFKATTTSGSPAFNGYLLYRQSDGVVVDASFIRLKNLSLSYNFPAKWIDKVKLKNLRIYTQGQNLFTITNYPGFDPETKSVRLPPLKMLTIGLQCTL